MRSCSCQSPSPKPQRPDTCVRCGIKLKPDTICNDATMAEFFNRLSDAFPDDPEWLKDFRIGCESRELAGRKKFGWAYFDRNNLREAEEEFFDGANYAMMEVLKNRRDGMDDQLDMALIVAWHASHAYAALRGMRLKERGRP